MSKKILTIGEIEERMGSPLDRGLTYEMFIGAKYRNDGPFVHLRVPDSFDYSRGESFIVNDFFCSNRQDKNYSYKL